MVRGGQKLWMGFSLYQMNPWQGWLNRASEPSAGSPELALQQISHGKVMSIVGSRERELGGQVQSPPVLVRFSIELDWKSKCSSEGQLH